MSSLVDCLENIVFKAFKTLQIMDFMSLCLKATFDVLGIMFEDLQWLWREIRL